jgi:hypothetical protein
MNDVREIAVELAPMGAGGVLRRCRWRWGMGDSRG